MIDKSTKNLIVIIALTALVMGLFLGLTIKSLRGDDNVFVFKNVEKMCNPLGTGKSNYSSCNMVLVGGILVSFVVGAFEVIRLRSDIGKYNVGVISYLSGSIIGFIITSSL